MIVRHLQNDELYHHGVKGQKWGIRRYQNPDGTLTPAGMRRYDYTTSDAYKNASGRDKAIMTNTHKSLSNYVGKKNANSIMYKKNNNMYKDEAEYKKDVKKARARVNAKAALASAAILTAANIGMLAYEKKKNEMDYHMRLNNSMVDIVGKGMELNEVKGRFTPGFKQVANGKKIADKILNDDVAEAMFKAAYHRSKW